MGGAKVLRADAACPAIDAAHWFDDIKEGLKTSYIGPCTDQNVGSDLSMLFCVAVIFEFNKILPAGTAISWGNNIDNYSNGYAQHVWHAFNSFSTEWCAHCARV